jgi:hypothetical protein
MLALRLFLPESWTSKRARLERAGVPAEYRTARTKPEMALSEIDHAIAAGVRFGCVLADAGYGLSAPFRQELTARKLAWAVGIPRHLKVYPADVQMIWPVAKRGRPRQRHVPDVLSIPAEDMLANAKWRTIRKCDGACTSQFPNREGRSASPVRVIRSISGLPLAFGLPLTDMNDLIIRRPPCVAERVFGIGAVRIIFECRVMQPLLDGLPCRHLTLGQKAIHCIAQLNIKSRVPKA